MRLISRIYRQHYPFSPWATVIIKGTTGDYRSDILDPGAWTTLLLTWMHDEREAYSYLRDIAMWLNLELAYDGRLVQPGTRDLVTQRWLNDSLQ